MQHRNWRLRIEDMLEAIQHVQQYTQGMSPQAFTSDQKKWLDAIKDHIASSLAIEQDDLEEVPFNTIGGLGRAYELFGDRLAPILDELNMDFHQNYYNCSVNLIYKALKN